MTNHQDPVAPRADRDAAQRAASERHSARGRAQRERVIASLLRCPDRAN